jgi:hypothetical protein
MTSPQIIYADDLEFRRRDRRCALWNFAFLELTRPDQIGQLRGTFTT